MPIATNTNNKERTGVPKTITQDDHYSQFGLDSDSEDGSLSSDGEDVEVVKTVRRSGHSKVGRSTNSEYDLSTDNVLSPPNHHRKKRCLTPSSSKSSKQARRVNRSSSSSSIKPPSTPRLVKQP